MINKYLFTSLIYIAYFTAVFLGPSLYFAKPQLQAVRLIPILLIPYLWCKYIASNPRQIIHSWFIVFAITTYYLYNNIISFFNIDLININSIINFTVLFLLLLITVFLFSIDWNVAINTFTFFSFAFYTSCIVLGIYEVNTGNHLAISAANLYPEWNRYIPTTFYHNTNDFAAIHVLLFIFIYTYAIVYNKGKLLNTLMLLLPVSFYLYLEAKSRLSIFCILYFLLFNMNFKNKLKAILITLFILAIASYFAINVQKAVVDATNKFVNNQFMFSDNSTKNRIYLYRQASKSVIDSYGFGFGVDASSRYFGNVIGRNGDGTANPHGFIFELLINGGLPTFIGYIVFMIYLMKSLALEFRYKYLNYLFIYNLLLFSSSSSLFLWAHYIISIAIWFIYLNANFTRILTEEKNAFYSPYHSSLPQ